MRPASREETFAGLEEEDEGRSEPDTMPPPAYDPFEDTTGRLLPPRKPEQPTVERYDKDLAAVTVVPRAPKVPEVPERRPDQMWDDGDDLTTINPPHRR